MGVKRLMLKHWQQSLVLGMSLLFSSSAFAKVSVGDKPLKKMAVTNGEGKPLKRVAKKNIVVLAFGASWCAPCKKELPAYEKLAKKHKGKVSFVAINVDEDIEKGKSFMEEAGLKAMLGVYDAKQKTMDLFEPPKMPTTYILKNAKVVYVHGGFAKGDEAVLDAELKKLIK